MHYMYLHAMAVMKVENLPFGGSLIKKIKSFRNTNDLQQKMLLHDDQYD